MPAGTTMGHMHLSVNDLESARAFYHEALGLDLRVGAIPARCFSQPAVPPSCRPQHVGCWCTPCGIRRRAAGRVAPRLPSAEDVTSAASRLESAGYAVRAEGDDRVAIDPWNTALRLTAEAYGSARYRKLRNRTSPCRRRTAPEQAQEIVGDVVMIARDFHRRGRSAPTSRHRRCSAS